ncbi:MAG TPA: hypothetical protein VG900_12745, partial [Hyphomicrobiaceae bacterium]|nr:hypothetical protein [Hyphomicrobiaceae bacterium]
QALGDTLGTTVQSLAGDVVSPVLSEVGGLTQSLGDTLGTTVQSLAGDVVAPILSDIGLVLDPGEVLGDLGNGALSSLTAPLGDAGQIVQSLAADVAGPLASDVGGLVQPVGDVLGQLANIGLSLDADGTLGSLGHSLSGLLGDATDTAQASGLPDVSGPALTAPIGDILASAPTVADLAQPVGDIAASALPQVSSLLGGLDGLGESTGIQLDAGQADSLSSIGGSLTGALDDIVGSGGSLALNPPVLGSATIDDLFNSAGYTNYNLSLQAESPGTTGQLPGPVIADATTLLDQILGEPDHTDTSISSHDTQQQTQLVSLPSAIEDLLTRGHGDLL